MVGGGVQASFAEPGQGDPWQKQAKTPAICRNILCPTWCGAKLELYFLLGYLVSDLTQVTLFFYICFFIFKMRLNIFSSVLYMVVMRINRD